MSDVQLEPEGRKHALEEVKRRHPDRVSLKVRPPYYKKPEDSEDPEIRSCWPTAIVADQQGNLLIYALEDHGPRRIETELAPLKQEGA